MEKQSGRTDCSSYSVKLNMVHLIPKDISLIGARNLGWDKWETESFKWILKKCDVEEMMRRLYSS